MASFRIIHQNKILMTEEQLIEKIKNVCGISTVDWSLIFQDGFQIYYNGEYVCNLNNK